MSRGRVLDAASLVTLAAILFIRPLVSSASLPGFNAVFLAALLAACIMKALALLLGSREDGATATADCLAYLFLAVLGAGCLRSPDRAGAIDSFYPLAAALLAYLLASRLGGERGSRDALLASLCAALLVVAVWGIYQYYYGLEELRERAAAEGWPIDELARARMAMERVYAGFVSPNALAGFIALLAPVLFCFILKAPRQYLVSLLQVAAVCCIVYALLIHSMVALVVALFYGCIVFIMRRRIGIRALRTAGVVPVGMVLACLFFTGSKSVYGIFAVSCFLLSIRLVKKKRLLLCAGAVALVAILLFAMYGADAAWRLKLTTGTRIDYWTGAVRVIKEYPLFGSGLGFFWCEYQRSMIPGADVVVHAHNSYLEIWAELGILGVAVFTALLCFSISKGFGKGADLIDVGAGIGLLAFALHNLVDFDLYVPELGLSAFAVAGLLASSEGGRGKRVRNYVFLGACGALLLVVGPRLANDAAAPELQWQVREAIAAGEYEAAHDIVPQALRSGPRRARLRMMVGDLFLREGNVERAIAEYRAAADANSRWATPHLYLGWAHVRRGEGDAALREFALAVALSPSRADIRLAHGDILRASGREDEAMAEYRVALELQRAVVERDERYRRKMLKQNSALLEAIEGRLSDGEK